MSKIDETFGWFLKDIYLEKTRQKGLHLFIYITQALLSIHVCNGFWGCDSASNLFTYFWKVLIKVPF